MNNPEIFVDLCPYADRVDLRLRVGGRQAGEHHDYSTWMKEPIFVYVEEGATPPVAVSLTTMEAQALMDRLWKAGLRPTEGSGSAGALAATERHLKDMQTLVFENNPKTTAREVMDAIRRETCRERSEVEPMIDPEVYRRMMNS